MGGGIERSEEDEMTCAAHMKTAGSRVKKKKNTTGHCEREQYGRLKNHRAI